MIYKRTGFYNEDISDEFDILSVRMIGFVLVKTCELNGGKKQILTSGKKCSQAMQTLVKNNCSYKKC